MTETILKMLEDPESCGDEINIFIWVYVNNHKDEDVSFYREIIPHPYGTEEERKSFILNSDQYEYIDYCGSLDAAMSIGAEELEGWVLTRTAELLDDTSLIFSTALSSGDGEILFANTIEDFANAICHARIQAVEYERGRR